MRLRLGLGSLLIAAGVASHGIVRAHVSRAREVDSRWR
jgi:hypothetical protein